ncbi:hypothetical protein [Streptomyces sp. EAS-AB2608]|uniref:hypothetical protein n=1 Tax=Streptomyces sp. EAS-AB2608 TaxID=2779671 RepID=UPI0037D9BD2C
MATTLAVHPPTDVLTTPSGERLTDLETWVGTEGVLHVNGSVYDATRFTGTPVSGLVLKPLARPAEAASAGAGPVPSTAACAIRPGPSPRWTRALCTAPNCPTPRSGSGSRRRSGSSCRPARGRR